MPFKRSCDWKCSGLTVPVNLLSSLCELFVGTVQTHNKKSCLLPRKAYFLIYSLFEQLLSTINLKRLLSVNNPLEFSLKQALTCTCSRVFTLEWFTLVLTLHPVPASVIKAGVYRGMEGQGSRQ